MNAAVPVHIAVVDDEVDITRLLAGYLQQQGYRVTALQAGTSLMALMADDPPALVLLDVGLPGEDGFAIARELRARWRCGVVFVSGRGDAIDKVVGLEVGADDYVTKPFDLRELLARIKAVLRRLQPPELPAVASAGRAGHISQNAGVGLSTPVAPPGAPATATPRRYTFAGWTLDPAARRLDDATGAEVPLTGGEFDLLLAFVEHPGRVLTRDFLLERTRGREAGPYDRTIDVQVGRLRRKLEVDSERPQIIKSVRGAGYILVPPVSG